MKILKRMVKKNRLMFLAYEFFFQRPMLNVFNRENSRSVLFSYSTYHFRRKGYSAHSNYQESIVIAQILDALGYNVDVVNNNKEVSLDFSKYSMIFGEGLPIYQAVISGYKGKVVYYATGSHPWHCSNGSLARLLDFARRYNDFPVNSLRIQDYRWGIAASCAARVICIGNQHTKQTFTATGVANIDLVRPTFHKSKQSYGRDLKNIAFSRKTALWFGSYGLLHKGLDLAVEAFRRRPDWTLHVCGYTDAEYNMIAAIDVPQNVHIHGFLDVNSSFFSELSSSCLYVLLPSCSEGIATSVITAMGRGGMIPVVTKEAGVDLGDYGVEISGLASDDVCRALEQCDSLEDEKLLEMGKKSYLYANQNYSIDAFKDRMENLLRESLEFVD